MFSCEHIRNCTTINDSVNFSSSNGMIRRSGSYPRKENEADVRWSAM